MADLDTPCFLAVSDKFFPLLAWSSSIIFSFSASFLYPAPLLVILPIRIVDLMKMLHIVVVIVYYVSYNVFTISSYEEDFIRERTFLIHTYAMIIT